MIYGAMIFDDGTRFNCYIDITEERYSVNQSYIGSTNFIPSPSVKSVFSVATSVSNINEGSSINFDITATGYGTGIVYWIITGGATAADFSDTGAFAGISGKVVITNNVGRVTKSCRNPLN